jgi:UDP-GlcNAc:undecaprenyl-phosphate/decaprenyl-phosphate GlcNAc-1-phosphate transferase
VRFPLNVYWAALVGGALATALTVPLWRKWCQWAGLVDEPGERKIHSRTIPLAGGLAVMSGLVLPLLAGVIAALVLPGWSSAVARSPWAVPHPTTLSLFQYGLGRRGIQLLGIVAGALAMLFLGLLDDKVELRPAVKFGGQLLAALMVAAAGVRITLFVPSVAFHYFVTALWILTVVNAFNFMDNMNGLCAGLGLIGAAYFGMFSALEGQYLVATTAFLVTGALAGFLPFNFPKASVFLGDSGSHLVGYLLAALAILPHFYTAKHPRVLAVLTPLLILAVPLADLAWVVLLRWKMGKPFYIGDTNHWSHRLVRRGWSRGQAVVFIWAAAAAAGATAFIWR